MGHVQGGKEGRGTATDVAVRDAFDVSEPKGQQRLGSLQRLRPYVNVFTGR